MKKLISLLCLFLFLLFSYSQEKPNLKIFESCLYPTVMVIDAINQSGGTGFLVRSTKHGKKYRNALITAQHTVEGNGPFLVKQFKYKNISEVESEKTMPMFIYALEENMDLAIGVFESDEKMPVMELDFNHKTMMGSNIFHVGFGMMDDARIDYGQITQTKTSKPEIFKDLIRTNAYSMIGDSGGPLCQTNDFKVIGVCKAIRKHKDQLMNHQSYFTDIKMLKKWNDELDNALEPIYTEKRSLPVIPFVKIELQNYKYKLPD